VRINGSKYVDVDSQLIATGKLLDVENTLFDFRTAASLGPRLHEKEIKENKATNGGYDHTFLIDDTLAKSDEGGLKLAAEATTGAKGRTLRVYTDMPAVHLYTGNFLDNTNGKAGAKYGKHQGFCLECENLPNAINLEGKEGVDTAFKPIIVGPSKAYKGTIVFDFSSVARLGGPGGP